MRLYFFVLSFILPLICMGQGDMDPGFKMLEKGSFEDATTFFDAYLEEHPENKTAQICYGRAVGLSGAPEKANSLFGSLAQKYPNDFEVAINYCESFLWAKDYKTAKPLYENLVAEYPTKFGAVLGYANTLSNLKEYEAALQWISKALKLQPQNKSAKVSRKYIKLGYANTFVNNQDYERGKTYLNEIFADFPEDKDALLNLANLYLITKETDSAKATYWRYATSTKDSISALNGIVLAEHIAENDKRALEWALSAKKKVLNLDDTELEERTYDRYVQALIWNRKFKTARKQIDSLQKSQGDRNYIFALRATLGMYTGDFKASLQSYDAILESDSTSFDGNLGKANALFASDRIIPAYGAAYQTLNVFENQKDALQFVEKLNIMHLPTVEEQAAYTFDNGNNVAFANTLTAFIPLSTKFKTSISYQFRTTENTVTLNQAESHVALVGMDYTLYPNVHVKTVVGLNNSRFLQTAYTQPVLDTKLALKPYALQNLELGYQREVQNFNAELIEREIVMNHYGLTYNLGTNVNLGWYTQLMHTEQTDENTRDLLFTSLYYTVMQKPALKLGLNYQYISFGEQVPTIYFSPEQYQAGEVFADFRGNISEKTSYMASAATGLQKVEDDAQTTIFRAEAALLHQFGKRLSANIYGKY
ncbi:hypothetical protein LCGC14_1224380, partial [marine sediment metagenome]